MWYGNNASGCRHARFILFQEFQKMKQLDRRYINCKRCLQALQLRDLIEDGEV